MRPERKLEVYGICVTDSGTVSVRVIFVATGKGQIYVFITIQ